MTYREAVQAELRKVKECQDHLEEMLRNCCDNCGNLVGLYCREHLGLCKPCYEEFARDMDMMQGGFDSVETYEAAMIERGEGGK